MNNDNMRSTLADTMRKRLADAGVSKTTSEQFIQQWAAQRNQLFNERYERLAALDFAAVDFGADMHLTAAIFNDVVEAMLTRRDYDTITRLLDAIEADEHRQAWAGVLLLELERTRTTAYSAFSLPMLPTDEDLDKVLAVTKRARKLRGLWE